MHFNEYKQFYIGLGDFGENFKVFLFFCFFFFEPFYFFFSLILFLFVLFTFLSTDTQGFLPTNILVQYGNGQVQSVSQPEEYGSDADDMGIYAQQQQAQVNSVLPEY